MFQRCEGYVQHKRIGMLTLETVSANRNDYLLISQPIIDFSYLWRFANFSEDLCLSIIREITLIAGKA